MVAAVGDGRPSWTILIPTLGQRRDQLRRLLDVLLPQLDAYDGWVRVLAWWNVGSPPLPEIRQGLVDAATADYVSFVDDDDMVPDYFADEVMAALEAWPDKVSWQTQIYLRGKPKQIAYHGLKYGRWYAERGGDLFRDVTHITPIKTSIARLADFRRNPLGKPEDQAWVAQVRGHLRTEVVIDKIMYHYFYDPAMSVRRPDRIHKGPFVPYWPDSPHFAYYRMSSS